MSFVFNNCTIGDGAQFITVEAGASLTLQLGSGYRTANNSTANSARCPLKLSEYKSQLKGWAQRCAKTQAPEGYHTETWGGSPKVFDDGAAPSGLNKGDALFFWKGGVTDPKNHPTPEGFEAVYALEDILIVAPTNGDEHLVASTDQANLDADGEDELSGAEASLEFSQSFNHWDDDEDEEEDDGEPTTDRLDDDDGDNEDEDESLDF